MARFVSLCFVLSFVLSSASAYSCHSFTKVDSKKRSCHEQEVLHAVHLSYAMQDIEHECPICMANLCRIEFTYESSALGVPSTKICKSKEILFSSYNIALSTKHMPKQIELPERFNWQAVYSIFII